MIDKFISPGWLFFVERDELCKTVGAEGGIGCDQSGWVKINREEK